MQLAMTSKRKSLIASERIKIMSDIRAIIFNKKIEDVTREELDALQLEIEETWQTVNKLQSVHRSITGRDHIPSIKL